MGLYKNILKYQLNSLTSEQETLFTYFDLNYQFNDSEITNPSVVITLKSKIKGIDLARLYVDLLGNEDSKCYFCSHNRCEHIQIMVTKLLQDNAFISQLQQMDFLAANHLYIEQQNAFDEEINDIFNQLYNEDSPLLHLAHITPCLEDVRNVYSLQLKIGINKFYKIPSIYQFLMRFRHKEVFQYGKELKIVHKLSNFDKESASLISYLKDNIDQIDRYVTLKKKALDNLCEIYLNSHIEIDGQDYYVSKETLNIKFSINKQYQIQFHYLDEGYIPFGERFYINNKDRIIKPIVEDKSLAALIDSINKYPLANIKNRFYEFKHTYFLKYPDLFEIDEELQGILNNEPLKIKSYFDYDKKDDAILLESKYYRNDEEIDIQSISSIYEKRYLDQYHKTIERYGFKDDKMTNHADVFNFINGSLQDIRLLSEIYISESLSKMNVISFTPPKLNINRNGNILDVFLDESEFDEKELKQILSAIKKKKKYIILKDNFIDLSSSNNEKFFEDVENYDLLSQKDLKAHHKLPLYYAFKSLDSDSGELQIDEVINQVFTQVRDFSNAKINIPKINGKLRGYQKDGVKWLNVLYQNGLGGILADDMGLGKTIETIAFIKCIQKDAPILIVCPKSLLFNWQNEFKTFAPEIPTYAIHGVVNERKKIISSINNDSFGVYFISYDSLRNEIDNLKNIHFDMAILDEAQFIKNAFAKKTSAVKSLSADHYYALTGTPIENNIFDLWSIFDFLMPGYLLDLKEFKDRYEKDNNYSIKIKTMTSPFILRRKKEDVLKDLPDKYEVIYTVEMGKEQRKIYEAYRMQMQESLKMDNSHIIEVLGAITRLRQICVDPSMFIDNYHGGSAKLDYLLDLLNEKIKDGHRLLIFSQFVKVLDNIKALLKKNNINYKTIIGDTPAKERTEICNDFNNNDDIKVVLISLKAGGTGLNLIGADTVIHMDPWWNLAAQNQASDRAHRIGQTRAVEVIKIIAENSIEQKVLDIQNEKKQLVELMISDNEESIKKLSINELKDLLSSH